MLARERPNCYMKAMNVVVGGGLLGCAVALELARRGCPVVVLEKAIVGAEASSAAGGILAPRIEAHGREPLRTLACESLGMYPAWVESLGCEVGFRRSGALVVAADRPDVDAIWLDDARTVEPALRPAGAWWLPEEAVVNPRLLVPAVRAAAEAAGACFRVGAEVAHVDENGVTLTTGEVLAGRVVVCAGAWTSRVPGLGSLPIAPVRGQMVAIEGVALRRVVFGSGGYVVPRSERLVVAGTTVERVGFERGVTVAGLRQVLDAATALVPGLATGMFQSAWSGFRPGTPDDLPILGEVDGVWVASGHYRNGILLAPLTARVIARGLCDGERPPAELSPARF